MKYFIANWKMNMDLKSITEWYPLFEHELQVKEDWYKIIVAPSMAHLAILKEFPDPMIKLAAQDVSHYQKGAHTGETGAFQIKELCDYAIVGHSERKEPLEIVIAKRDACVNAGITPIVCFVTPEDAQKLVTENIIMAWEDPSNISVDGKYRDKDPIDIQHGVAKLREIIPESISLLYGGSVNKNNIKNVSSIKGVDGVLVGNASLDPIHFSDIIRNYVL